MRSLLRMLPNYHREGVILPRPPGGGGGGGTGGGGGAIDWPAPTYISSHFVDYARQPGDQVIVVDDVDLDLDGFIGANQDQFVHPPTDGPFGGWLIILANNYLGPSIVGTANQLMQFYGGSSGRDFRIAIIGFHVDVYTNLHTAGYMRWVWTEHTNPIDRWWATYTSRGGTMAGNDSDRNILDNITRWPSGFRIEVRGTDFHSHHLEFLGVDMHDIGDDGWFTSRVYDSLWQGIKAWRIGSENRNPGFGSARGDFFHSDSLQVTGDFVGNTIRDSWLGNENTIAADLNGHIRDTSFLNNWLAGGNVWAMQLGRLTTREITNCEITGVRAFGNGQKWDANWLPHYYAPYDVPFDSIVENRSTGELLYNVLYPQTLDGVVSNFDIPISGVDLTVPADVRIVGGNIVDINDLVVSAYNPANVWRAAHPYEDVLTWLTDEYGWP